MDTRYIPALCWPVVFCSLLTLCLATCSGGAAARKHRDYQKKQTRVTGLRWVERVIDGDTVVLDGGDRVRLIAVNASEIDEELGKEACDFTVEFCFRKKVMVDSERRDPYGRLLSDIVVEGRSLSLSLITRGLAHVFLVEPVEPSVTLPLIEAQRAARAARRGIWALPRFQRGFHITSFHADPKGDDNERLNDEYLRVTSLSEQPVSLKGYTIANNAGERYTFGDVTLPPCHTVVLRTGTGEDLLDPKGQITCFWNRTREVWDNQGDTVSLRDPDGVLVDQVTFDPNAKKEYPK